MLFATTHRPAQDEFRRFGKIYKVRRKARAGMQAYSFCPLHETMVDADVDADTRHLASCCMQIWIARKPPGFAFIDYEDYRDAEDAVRKLDGE